MIQATFQPLSVACHQYQSTTESRRH